MGFNSVYRALQELFPTVDARMLKAVAIEHPKDADAAAEVVLTEVLPFMSCSVDHNFPPADKNSGGSVDGGVVCNDATFTKNNVEHVTKHQRHGKDVTRVSSSVSVPSDTLSGGNMQNIISKDLVENDLSGPKPHNAVDGNVQSSNASGPPSRAISSGEETGSDQVYCVASSSLLDKDCTNYYQDERHEASGSVEQTSITKCEENGTKDEAKNIQAINMIHDADNISGNPNNQYHKLKEFDGPNRGDFTAVADDKDHQNGDFSSNSSLVGIENAVGLQDLRHADGCSHSASDSALCSGSPSGSLNVVCKTQATDPPDITCDQEFLFGETSTFEEPVLESVVTRSGQVCRIDVLEEIIEDAKNYKRTLFSAMESVISMMREVEIYEKAANEAKEEAAKGGVDILNKVEELKQMVAHAKEANDMHAGEVFGEKAVLATEVRELQSRLLGLSDERDKSLNMLEEMRRTLETRLAAADELRKSAEQEKAEKEESAKEALGEQEAKLEMVIREGKLLQQQAEENSRLREFLVDRGRLVDTLQGEISVICQDVRLLKEKFDEGIPLCEHVSSSQTTCILASSSSSSRSKASDLVSEEGDTMFLKTSSASSVDGQSGRSLQRDLSRKENITAADRNMLADGGWELCDEDDAF